MAKTYYFLRNNDTDEYLQHRTDFVKGTHEFWFATQRAWTPSFESEADAVRFREQVLIMRGFILRVSKEEL